MLVPQIGADEKVFGSHHSKISPIFVQKVVKKSELIMHNLAPRAMHYAICTMQEISWEHGWFPPQSYVL